MTQDGDALPAPGMATTGGDGQAVGESGCMDIDLDAVLANFAEIRRLAGRRRKVIATVKADAYGHGCVAIARCLQEAGAAYFAAGTLADAAAMRTAGVTAPMILLNGLRPDMIGRVIELGLMPTLSDIEMAEAMSRAVSRPTSVCIKVDCGFGRFGVPLVEAHRFVRRVASLKGLWVEGVYTHIPFSDPGGLDWARERLRAFAALLSALDRDGLQPTITQALASAGVFAGLDDPSNAVAIGHVLYGLRAASPAVDGPGRAVTLRPALRAVRTRLMQVGRRPPAGEEHPYLRNATGAVGVVPIGLSHAYRPTAPEAFMIVAGGKAPILRVSLESTVLDLAGVKAVAGDEVLVLGATGELRITLDTLAGWQATSPLALVTGLGRSLPRRYVGDAARA